MATREKRTRRQPYPYTYYGLTVYIRHIHNSDGAIVRFDISIRDDCPQYGIHDYGKVLFSRRYQVGSKISITEDSTDMVQVLHGRLDSILPNQFFPSYFEEHREALHNELQLSVVLPYAWKQTQRLLQYADASLEDKDPAMKTMLQTFGTWRIRDLTPAAVAPELNQIAQQSKKTAKQCNIIFHRIFESVLHNVDRVVAESWQSYHFHAPKGSYLPTYQTRKRLLAPVLNELQCKEILQRCIAGITTKDASKYFAAAVMLIEGVSLQEVCALQLDCFCAMKCYPGCYLQISKEIVNMSGKQPKKETSQAKYTIKDPEDIYQYRNIGVGNLLSNLLDKLKCRGVDQTSLLLNRDHNKKRIMRPDAFESWLEKAFRDIVGNPEIFSDKTIESTASISDYLNSTAMYMYRTYGMTDEELFHHFGLPPKSTDGIYYADFNAECALVKISKIQDLWVSNILPSTDTLREEDGYETIAQIGGTPHQIPYLEITIDVPPKTHLDQDIVVKLIGQYGFSASIMTNAPEHD